MAEIGLTLDLDSMSPIELENRRRELVSELATKYKGYDDPEIPTSALHELAAITGAVRRRTAGPPKAAKKSSSAKTPKASAVDLLSDL